MKPRSLIAGVVIMLWATMAGSPASADNADEDSASLVPQRPTVLRFGGPSMSWEEATSQGDRQLTEAESEEAVKQTIRDSSMRHYYPELPDDPIENPSPQSMPGNETTKESRGK